MIAPVAGKPAVFYGELRRAGHKIDMKKKAVIVSGYFNPIHKGHLEYFNNAKAIADELFVIANNDHQRALKGSKEFQSEEEQMILVSNIKAVDHAIFSVDEDRIVCAPLEKSLKNLVIAMT
jgi:cytidyltransferase-like protein